MKPNPTKTAGGFDRGMALTQLKYSGMLETVRIRKAGFGSRMSFIDFYDRLDFWSIVVETVLILCVDTSACVQKW